MKKTKNTIPLSRREFLSQATKAGLATAAFDTIFSSLLSSQLARAAVPDSSFKNFLYLNMFGAPPRWMYDLILNPNNKPSEMMANPMVSNHYIKSNSSSSGYDSADYKLVNYRSSGVWVPYLLSQTIPLSTGSVQAWNILDHSLLVRGIDIQNPAHNAVQLHQAGVAGAQTLSSVTADLANPDPQDPTKNLLRSILLNPNPSSLFSSKLGYTAFAYSVSNKSSSTRNNLTDLFASMRPIARDSTNYPSQFVNNNNMLLSNINTAMNSLDPGAAFYQKQLMDNNKTALSILVGNSVDTFSDLIGDWNTLYSKYMNNLTGPNGVLNSTYAGINDQPIGVALTEANKLTYQFPSQGRYTQNKDAQGHVDLREILANVDPSALASQFAVVEFLMTRGICPSISLNVAAFQKVAGAYPGVEQFNMGFDQHFTGFMPGIVLNSMYYLCFTACVLELIEALKDKGLFNDTLIYLAGEFNRAPINTGGGSDHGYQGGSVNLISGRRGGFQLVGNIYVNSLGAGTNTASDKYSGTWGYGAPIVGGKALNIHNYWASVMNLLGVSTSDFPRTNIVADSLLFDGTSTFKLRAPFSAKPANKAN